MQVITQRVSKHIGSLPEGAAVGAKELLHLGSRAAVDQALSRMVRRKQLLRTARGLYVRPIETRFGMRAPSVEKVVESIAGLRGETVVRHGAAAANALGLTTQVPTRVAYLTSGPTRSLKLGGQEVELKHAPNWQMIKIGRSAGDAVRALAWLGPEHAKEALTTLKRKMPRAEFEELVATRSLLPGWLAERVSAELVPNG